MQTAQTKQADEPQCSEHLAKDCDESTDKGLREAIAASAQTLGSLFLSDPRQPKTRPLFEALRALPCLDDWPFGVPDKRACAYRLMQEGVSREEELAREYQRLFIGPQHFNAPAWGSVYLDRDQIRFGSSTLELRQWMREQGIVSQGRVDGDERDNERGDEHDRGRDNERDNEREPEDHIGRLLLLLAWLARENPGLMEEFCSVHLMTWAPRYLELLEDDARQPFYKGLAVLTRTTLQGIVEALGIEPQKRKLYF